jgi:hypothetical protein
MLVIVAPFLEFASVRLNCGLDARIRGWSPWPNPTVRLARKIKTPQTEHAKPQANRNSVPNAQESMRKKREKYPHRSHKANNQTQCLQARVLIESVHGADIKHGLARVNRTNQSRRGTIQGGASAEEVSTKRVQFARGFCRNGK